MTQGKATARVCGSTAPPITPEMLDRYEQLAQGHQDRMVSSYILDLISMLRKFHETPESSEAPIHHPFGTETPLEANEIERIWDVVPWSNECDLMGREFDSLTGDIRNAAYHLLWYARELTRDREPRTKDKHG